MTDFGADDAFGRASAKLREHDGIEMPVNTIQRMTEQPAQRIDEEAAARDTGNRLFPSSASMIFLSAAHEAFSKPASAYLFQARLNNVIISDV